MKAETDLPRIKTPVVYRIYDENRFGFVVFYGSDNETIEPEQITAAVNNAAQLEAEVARLRAALEHYANEKNWREVDVNESGMASTFWTWRGDYDGYDRAQQALSRTEDKAND